MVGWRCDSGCLKTTIGLKYETRPQSVIAKYLTWQNWFHHPNHPHTGKTRSSGIRIKEIEDTWIELNFWWFFFVFFVATLSMTLQTDQKKHPADQYLAHCLVLGVLVYLLVYDAGCNNSSIFCIFRFSWSRLSNRHFNVIVTRTPVRKHKKDIK